jgi:hypothetical protein
VAGVSLTYAHRFAWYLSRGALPRQQICHACDHPPCCNPHHLWEGTVTDNQRDCARKGRSTRRKPVAKLAPAQVGDIRTRWAAGESQRQIARSYGISQATVSHIITRRTWDDVA